MLRVREHPSPASARTPAAQRRREQILVGLAEAIRERGLDATGIEDIVRHAGVSRGAFHRSFVDKRDCVLALAEALGVLATAAVSEAVDRSAAWQVQVDQAVDAYVQVLALDPDMTGLYLGELPKLGLRAVRVRRMVIERYARLLMRLADSGRDAGVPAVSIDTAIMLMAGIDMLSERAVCRTQSPLELAPVAKDALKSALAPPRA